ncbi:ATP-dependent DNA ligase [Devosia rhizoryzae]|uniref:DNA ligase (ATP) n=1 Tax=Devosia rhizoryzae TaxID=2774137 RepID=A0ABX7C6G3_9HYPH|nr:ATP-dependent DNA ligase [Devosia rhizoryzae]QQR39332.1 ATP-dependent DNA ligase [Devosia rhizoryzae]
MPDLDFIAPMEAKLVTELPDGEGWQFEPKWDGFRCIAVKDGASTALFAKSGKDLGRYFPEVLALIEKLPAKRFVLDGELLVTVDGVASFDDLQQRLHPAESRIRKLSKETPALLVVFDLLVDGKSDLTAKPLKERRQRLETFLGKLSDVAGLRLSPVGRDVEEARGWFEHLSQELDGIICKRLDGPYKSGERAMLKVKRIRSADCVVGGFRYGTGSDEVGSLLLGFFNAEGKLDHVGFTSAISASEKPALTKKLEKLKGGSGFTGDAPGGPSRWSTERSSEWVPLMTELVVEVSYDQITGNRFRHGTRLLRWRPDKAPEQCTFEQLAEPVDPDAVIRAVVAPEAR